MTRDEAASLVGRALARVAPETDLAVLGPDDDLQGELGLDSIDFLGVIADVEAATGHEIPERDFPLLASVEGFVAYVAALEPAA